MPERGAPRQREQDREHPAERILRNAQSLDAFLREKIANLQQETATPVEELSKGSHLRDRLHVLQGSYPGVYLGLELLDAQGKVLARAGQNPEDHHHCAFLAVSTLHEALSGYMRLALEKQ